MLAADLPPRRVMSKVRLRIFIRPEAVWMFVARRNMTLAQFADIAGLTRLYMYQIIRAKRTVPHAARQAILGAVPKAKWDDFFVIREETNGAV